MFGGRALNPGRILEGAVDEDSGTNAATQAPTKDRAAVPCRVNSCMTLKRTQGTKKSVNTTNSKEEYVINWLKLSGC